MVNRHLNTPIAAFSSSFVSIPLSTMSNSMNRDYPKASVASSPQTFSPAASNPSSSVHPPPTPYYSYGPSGHAAYPPRHPGADGGLSSHASYGPAMSGPPMYQHPSAPATPHSAGSPTKHQQHGTPLVEGNGKPEGNSGSESHSPWKNRSHPMFAHPPYGAGAEVPVAWGEMQPPYYHYGPPIPLPLPPKHHHLAPSPHHSLHVPRDGRQAPYWNVRSTDVPPPRGQQKQQQDVDGRQGATSPTEIEIVHRDEVQHMGCTCKKTKCLKLYCQCFGVKIYCGGNCRCISCYNTRKNEKHRKEAMRQILLRNPGAFDTKFRKANGSAVATAAAVPVKEDKLLTHKTGCKCRKSACMKKYCECYAGSVKCSPSCRCIGCKNTSLPQFEPGRFYDPTRFAVQHPPPAHVLQAASAGKRATAATGPSGEPFVAAQNLTFLKHGSPSSESKKGKSEAELTSMPSLASSSEGTSPGGNDPTRKLPFGEGIDSLMMAAYAMTEFGQGSSPSKCRNASEKQALEDIMGPPVKRTRPNTKVPSVEGRALMLGHDGTTTTASV